MKNKQYVPVMAALLVLCSMAFLYGCGSGASGGGGGSTGSNWIYVGASDDLAISIINGSSNTLAGTIELTPRTPYHMAASVDGKHLYVSTDSLEVVIIDTASNTISGLITTDAVTQSYGMTVSANGAYLYFTRSNGNTLVRAYLKSDPITYETLATSAQPYGISLADNDEKCIIGEHLNLEFIDNVTWLSDNNIGISGNDLHSVAVKNNLAYVPRQAVSDILICDATNEVLLGIITPESANSFWGIVPVTGKNKLYVSQSSTPVGKVHIIDSTVPTFESTVITGESFTMSYPTYMASTSDGRYVYVYDDFALLTSTHHYQMCVIDTTTDKVTKNIPINSGANFDNNPVIIFK
jgi:DNA-binding beta-propeller fold protein YncE